MTRKYFKFAGYLGRWIFLFLFVVQAAPVRAYGEAASTAGGSVIATVSQPDAETIKQSLPKPGNVTVNFKEVEITTVLQYLSEVSGVDIIPAPGVEGTVTMRLRDKPWQVALDIITRNYGYAYSSDAEQGIIRVLPKDQLHSEEPQTEVIPLNHIIREIELSKSSGGSSGGGAMASLTGAVATQGASSSGDDVTIKEKKETIDQLLQAVRAVISTDAGESATFISSSNAIIVTAIPTRINAVKAMLEKIDKKTPQIMLDAKVIEIGLTSDERFGVDWNAIITASGARRPTTFPFKNSGVLPGLSGHEQRLFYPASDGYDGRTDFPIMNLLTTTTALPVPLTIDPSDSALFTYGTLDFSTFSATLSLLKERGDTEILSSPRITTLNNQKAAIKVVDKIMLQKTIETTQTADLVTVEFEDAEDAREVGVKLTVIPHVNESGDISVNLLPEVSTNSGFTELSVNATDSTIALTFSSREANTIIRVKDGETIFIGGLIKKNVTLTDNKLPILGDLLGGVPLLGSAFRYEAENVTRTEIVFFITVHIIPESYDSVTKAGMVDRYENYITEKREDVLLKEKDEKSKKDKKGTGTTAKSDDTGVSELKSEEEVVPVYTRKKEYKPFLDFRQGQ